MAILIAGLALSLSACGKAQTAATSGNNNNNTTAAAGPWSGFGVRTVTDTTGVSAINHNQYLAGSHSAYKCADCHVAGVAREATCVTCHPFSKYTAISMLSNVDHVAKGTGTQCNKCHYSHSGATANQGWRAPVINDPAIVAPTSRTRIAHTVWHTDIKGTCTDCHATSALAAYPVGHYTSACQSCNSYNGGSWKSTVGHTATLTACATAGCHTAKAHTIAGGSVTIGATFTGTDCYACHKPSIAAGFVDWKGSAGSLFHSGITGACLNCHTASRITTYPVGHYATACESCHIYNAGTWKGAIGHTSAKTGCNQSGCHATKTHSTVSSKTITAGQTFTGVSCELCHSASVTNAFKDWTGATHESVSKGCNTCHKYHHNSSDCANCHSGFSRWDG